MRIRRPLRAMLLVAIGVFGQRIADGIGDSTRDAQRARVIDTMDRIVLDRYASWRREYQGCPCYGDELGCHVLDPWLAPMQLLCARIDDHTMIGLVSAGPDGAFGTSDDIVVTRLAP